MTINSTLPIYTSGVPAPPDIGDDMVCDLADRHGVSVDVVRHSLRFRQVSNGYPRIVTQAYAGDIARAAADSDELVAATVAAWEQAHGLDVHDWWAIGTTEGRDR